jgi:hypothetical protein
MFSYRGLVRGVIPVAAPLAMLLLLADGFAVSALTGVRGAVFRFIFQYNKYYCIAARIVANMGARGKRRCDTALADAGTKVEPVPRADTTKTSGTYCKKVRQMYSGEVYATR